MFNEPGLLPLCCLQFLHKIKHSINMYLLKAREISYHSSYSWLNLLVSLLLTQQDFELPYRHLQEKKKPPDGLELLEMSR